MDITTNSDKNVVTPLAMPRRLMKDRKKMANKKIPIIAQPVIKRIKQQEPDSDEDEETSESEETEKKQRQKKQTIRKKTKKTEGPKRSLIRRLICFPCNMCCGIVNCTSKSLVGRCIGICVECGICLFVLVVVVFIAAISLIVVNKVSYAGYYWLTNGTLKHTNFK